MIIGYLIVGVLLTVIALLTKRYPPKKINHIYGYRTRRSMKNQRNWDFANQYSADLMLYVGLMSLGIGIVAYYILSETAGLLTALLLPCVLLILIIPMTEKKLKELEHDKEA